MKTIIRLILVLCCSLAISVVSAQSITFSYTGGTQTWTVPCGVTSATAYLWGGGGGGGGGGPTDGAEWQNGGGGGGGACIVTSAITLVPGQIYTVTVGDGGIAGNGSTPSAGGNGQTTTFTGFAGTWTASGGVGGTAQPSTVTTATAAGGAGATTGTGPGITIFSGGSGSTGYNNPGYSGSGGGGGGSSGNGATPVSGACSPGGAGGLGTYQGGVGGVNSGCNGFSNIAGGPGTTPAGGGAGDVDWTTGTAGGAGGNGQVIIVWNGPAPLSLNANTVSNVSCNGGSNGSANVAVTGGLTPYTYLWDPSFQTNATATGLSAGTYTIAVSDACGNTASASVAITQPATALAATATTTSNVTCNGGNTGATGSTVTGGTTPYTYAWTGGSTNATATGLTAGSYTLSVTDKNGCSATASTVVTQPNALFDSAFATANELCNGGSIGSAGSIVRGGNAPYTYLWTPGSGTTDTATGLSAGTYTLTVSDACGASATTSATITQPTAISITSHSAPDNGHGVGTAVVSVSGGVGPYTYLWTGGKTTDSIGGLTKGTYCVDVKDANGCKDSICVVVKTTAGIDGITDNATQIVVYPNPNNGQFTIESSVGGASTVEIYNILGEKVFTKNLSTTKGTNTISVNQPNGVYLYRIISDNGNLLGEGRISIQK